MTFIRKIIFITLAIILSPFIFIWVMFQTVYHKFNPRAKEDENEAWESDSDIIINSKLDKLLQNTHHTDVAKQSDEPSTRKVFNGERFSFNLYDLPFQPCESQIFYVEHTYNAEINCYIREHYNAIHSYCLSRGYEFCYLPVIVEKLQLKVIQDYYAPYSHTINNIDIDSSYLLRYLPSQFRERIKPSFIRFRSLPRKSDFIGATIDISKEHSFDLREIIDVITFTDVFFNYIPKEHWKPSKIFVDIETDEETQKLIEEFRQRVAILHQRGISEHLLQQMIATPQVVSRMIITRDYRIILPDYNNMEIEMTPLVKAVYLLFLRHSEGIAFKQLIDYRNELKMIYQQIKGETLNNKMKQSIEDITDPTKNSINEKCARIREAFVTRFDERLAVNYIVSGNRGESKRIPLNRDFVEWQ